MWPYCFKIPLKTLCIQALREKGVPFSQFPSNTKTFVIHCLVVVISHIYSPAIVALMKKKTGCSARSGKYFYCNIINTLLLILTWHLLGNRHKEELIDLRLDNLKHLYLCDLKKMVIWICANTGQSGQLKKVTYIEIHAIYGKEPWGWRFCWHIWEELVLTLWNLLRLSSFQILNSNFLSVQW